MGDAFPFGVGLMVGFVIGMFSFVVVTEVAGTSPAGMKAGYLSCMEDGGKFAHCVDKYLLLNEAKP